MFQIRTPQNPEDFTRLYDLRWRVLRAPWGQPPGSERDALDDRAHHVMVCTGEGHLIGVGRLHLNGPDEAQIRYMAVDPDWQGKGVGAVIVRHLEEIARTLSVRRIVLNARQAVERFYLRLGYHALGPGDLLFGEIAHVRMAKDLAPAALSPATHF